MNSVLLAILIAPGFIQSPSACQNYGGNPQYLRDQLGRTVYACQFWQWHTFDAAARDIAARQRRGA